MDFSDGNSKEVVTRYTTSIASRGVSYTDSNGREFMRRERDARPSWNYTVVAPVSGNYYPLSTAAGLSDAQSALYVLVDRAQGAASLRDGELEVMLHRRLLYSCFGFNLNETGGGAGLIIAGKHHVVLASRRARSSRRASSSSACTRRCGRCSLPPRRRPRRLWLSGRASTVACCGCRSCRPRCH